MELRREIFRDYSLVIFRFSYTADESGRIFESETFGVVSQMELFKVEHLSHFFRVRGVKTSPRYVRCKIRIEMTDFIFNAV